MCVGSSFYYGFVAAFGEEDSLYIILAMEAVFFINMIVKMLTTFVPEGESAEEKDLGVIAKEYIGDKFKLDLLCVIPFFLIFDNGADKYFRLFFLIKCLRIRRGNALADVGAIMNRIKHMKM